MKKLPIGLNSLKNIINDGFLYVDKTKKLYELLEHGRYFFFSRPRRFGKTLTVDTLKHIFEGNKDLFKGLYIYDKWNWEEKFPVIRIDFSTITPFTIEELETSLRKILRQINEELDLKIEDTRSISSFFSTIIREAYRKYKKEVVVLIDGCDKPIYNNLNNEEVAEEIRKYLAGFFGIIKGLDEYLRFVMLTGEYKFSFTNMFSGLNNLMDITVDHRFSDICGYTEEDLDKYFSEYLKGSDREEIRKWYNGYSWLGEKVYNPFDILLFISNEFQFRPYWFETGNPTFLIKLMKKKKYFIPELENIEATDSLLGSFDFYTMKIEALLWQIGYLTIKETIPMPDRSSLYVLSYPNLEVKKSLNNIFLKYLSSLTSDPKTELQEKLEEYLIEGNIDGLMENFKSLFASISYTNFTKNEIDAYEGYYASVIYSYLASLGIDLKPENTTNRGKIDLTVLLPDKAYIIEFKVKDGKEEKDPLQQIKEKKYYEKYINKVKEIYLIGITFDKEERNITEYKSEKMNGKIVKNEW